MKFKYNIERNSVYAQFSNPVFCKAIRLSRIDANSLALRNRLYRMESSGLVKINAVKKRHEFSYSLALDRGEVYILTNDLH